MPPDPRERFTTTVEDYARSRPSYPEALVDWLGGVTGVMPPARVADLGCGTGIASRLLAARGYRVTGIEPNAAMLARARGEGGGPVWQAGEAAATGLEAASVDLVTAAQAFHWFDVPAALREIARILRPGGWACAFWNIRATTPFLLEYSRLLDRFRQGPGRESVGAAQATLASLRASAAVTALAETDIPNRQRFDRAGLLGRARSTSYVQVEMPDRAGFERELSVLFDRFAHDGFVEFVYQCTALCWQMRHPKGGSHA